MMCALISRAGLKESVHNYFQGLVHVVIEDDVQACIDAAPSVTPEQMWHWIPVSKKLPEKSGEYWCTFGGTDHTGSDFYTTESDAKKLFEDPEEYTGWRSQNVIAWMPLPAAYKGESADKK